MPSESARKGAAQRKRSFGPETNAAKLIRHVESRRKGFSPIFVLSSPVAGRGKLREVSIVDRAVDRL